MSGDPTPGFRFKEGKLYIFTRDEIMLLYTWPELKAVRKSLELNKWGPFSPPFRLVAPYQRKAQRRTDAQMTFGFMNNGVRHSPTTARKRAFDSFRFSLPKNFAACIERFRCRQWQLLRLFKLEPRAVEVCRNNPALVFGLANAKWVLGLQVSSDVLAKWILGRQRDLLRRLRLPDSKSYAKILSKVAPESVSSQSLRSLIMMLGNEDIRKQLSHLQTINVGIIALLLDRLIRPYCTPRLLEDVSMQPAEKYRGITARYLLDIHRMTQGLGEGHEDHRYSSREMVMRDHERLSQDFSCRCKLKNRGIEFHLPPIPPTEEITPLRTEEELYREGRQQSNCVGSYTEEVLKGKTYIYRVLAPERATLSIVQNESGNWEVDQLLASHNRPVQQPTRAMVDSWIKEYMIGL